MRTKNKNKNKTKIFSHIKMEPKNLFINKIKFRIHLKIIIVIMKTINKQVKLSDPRAAISYYFKWARSYLFPSHKICGQIQSKISLL